MGRFSLNPKIKGYVEWQLEHYHEDKKQLEQHKKDLIPSTTSNYSLTAGCSSGTTSNLTEKTAIKLATNPYILSMERSIKAVEVALSRCDETDKQLIDLVYWRRIYTIEGASIKANVSRRTAYRKINNVLCRIALEMGLINL